MAQTPDKQTLEEMLGRAGRGDEQAWRSIIEAYSPRVFGLIRAQCGDVELAEEITQSTFCTIVSKIESYTELGRFEAWIFRIAMNRLRDEMRRRSRQARPVEHQALTGLAGADPSAVDPTEVWPELSEGLQRALGQLSDADQRIIHLRHFAGLGFKLIADVLGQPLGTVLARHHRALRKLRDLMATLDPDRGDRQ
ncbi:MAG: RNA polymerase sigma factor [Planctomycetota bacterium]|jgi:RNA polymerase sigma-70 factor (ECF subfamily)